MGNDVTGIIFYGVPFDEDDSKTWRYEGLDAEEFYAQSTAKSWEDTGCVIGYFDDCEVVCQGYVALADANFEGWCRPPQEFDPRKLTLPPNPDEKIKKVCKALGIPYREPKWYLVGGYA